MSAHLNKNKGFTLIELLVAISIVAILSTIGVTLFTNTQKGARDAKRKGDIDAITKAYEAKYFTKYQEITSNNFASGVIPTDPRGNNYFRYVSTKGFKACASLDASRNPICNTPSDACYCRFSQQGVLGDNDSPITGAGYGTSLIGIGGNISNSCDPGTLLLGLMGYWKFDEGGGTIIADSSGNGNTGTLEAGTTFSNGGSCISRSCLLSPSNKTNYATIPITSSSSLNLGSSDFTISGWVTAPNPGGSAGTGIFGKYQHNPPEDFQGNFVVGFRDTSNRLFFSFVNSSGVKFNADYYSQQDPGTNLYAPYWGVKTLITWVKSGNDLLLYLNDGPYKQKWDITAYPYSVNFYGNGNIYYIAHSGWDPGTWNNIVIDDHRIYNRALSQQEITALYGPSGTGCVP